MIILSVREHQVAELVHAGKTSGEISETIGVNLCTVRDLITVVRTKLGLNLYNRAPIDARIFELRGKIMQIGMHNIDARGRYHKKPPIDERDQRRIKIIKTIAQEKREAKAEVASLKPMEMPDDYFKDDPRSYIEPSGGRPVFIRTGIWFPRT